MGLKLWDPTLSFPGTASLRVGPGGSALAEGYLKALTDNKPLQLVFYLQLLSFEFVHERIVGQRSSFFFDQDMFDFCVLGSKSFVPRILTHGWRTSGSSSEQRDSSANDGPLPIPAHKALN
jgi:hypothetical protein